MQRLRIEKYATTGYRVSRPKQATAQRRRSARKSLKQDTYPWMIYGPIAKTDRGCGCAPRADAFVLFFTSILNRFVRRNQGSCDRLIFHAGKLYRIRQGQRTGDKKIEEFSGWTSEGIQQQTRIAHTESVSVPKKRFPGFVRLSDASERAKLLWNL